jgi:hypothetical protein
MYWGIDIWVLAVVKETSLREFELLGCILHVLDAELLEVQLIRVVGFLVNRALLGVDGALSPEQVFRFNHQIKLKLLNAKFEVS